MRNFYKSLPLGIALAFVFSSVRLQAQQIVSQHALPETAYLDGHLQRQFIRIASPNQILVFQNLFPGETYKLKVPKNPMADLCMPAMSLLNPGDSAFLSYNEALHELRFKANKETMEFLFAYDCSWEADNYPTHYVSLICESCQKQSLREFLRSSAGELMVTPNINAQSLIRDVLIGGECFDVTNVTYQGHPSQIGTFSNGQTNIGFSEGVVMATGNALVATGPNTNNNADMGFGNYTPDAELGELSAGGDTYDMADIEFDFRPTQSQVSFEFVFASEEYCEYVGSPFNDAFGFFISGPGINGPFNGAENIALIPSTTTYVAINNVNHILNPGYFVNNTPPTGTLCGQTGVNTPAVNQIQFDGFTKKITVRATLQTCKTYHIKLKIADVADGIFDSAVFLKAGSFDAGGNASVHWVVNGQVDAPEAYENCGDVSLVFRRVGGNIGEPLIVNYTVSGSASSGDDYNGIPSSITIPAGQQQVTIPVNILADALAENPETIQVMLGSLCNCSRPQEILTILDVLPLQLATDTVQICEPGQATVHVDVNGGAGPFTYEWPNGENAASYSPMVSATQTYNVTVTDNCQVSSVATALVEVAPPVTAQLQSPAPQLCFGQADSLTILFSGAPPYSLQYTLDGAPQTPIENIQSSPFRLQVTQPGMYQLTAVSNGECEGTASGTLEVTEAFINISSSVSQISCAGMNNGAISPMAVGGQAPYAYTWSGPQTIPPNTVQATNLQAGQYQLTVSDALGCRALETFTITEPDTLETDIAGITGTNCNQPAAGSINLEITGGTPGYSYEWSNDSIMQDLQGLEAGNYTVTVSDLSGCTTTATATVPGDFAAPTANAETAGALSCATLSIDLDGSASSSGQGFSYLWTATNGGNISMGATTLHPMVDAPGTYTLTVRNNLNGCTATDSVEQTSIVNYPQANGGPDQVLTCFTSSLNLNGTGSSQGSQFGYHWTASNGGTIINGTNTLQPLVGSGGTYTLQVTNNSNGCKSIDVVELTENNAAPVSAVAPPDSLTCAIIAVTLQGSSIPNTGVTYQWVTSDGIIQSGLSMPTAVVTEPGLYTFITTFDGNGCADSVSVSVEQNYGEPLAIVTPSNELDCSNSIITLDGAASVLSANTTFEWTASGTGHFLSGENTLTPVIDAPGTYTLLLINNANSCTSSATVLIENNNDVPPADAGDSGTLTCADTTLMLGNTLTNPAYEYSWTAANGGNFVTGANTATPVIDAPGTYFLTVLNTLNGCAITDSVDIFENTQLPTAAASNNDILDCIHPSLQLSGTGSSTGPNFTYHWTSSTGTGISMGPNSLTPTVTGPFTYTLVVTNQLTGCQSSASTTVVSNAMPPNVMAAPVGMLNCLNETVQINANGTDSGPGIFYIWSGSPAPVLAGQGSLQATVGTPGLYTLLVQNTNNACTASFTVEVTQDTVTPVADAGTGQILLCTAPSITLDGSGSSTGTDIVYQWTALDDGNFITPTNIQSPEINAPGVYQLLVTDTSNGCTDTALLEIDTDPNQPVVQIEAPGILNCNVVQLLIDASASSIGTDFSYQWTGPGILSSDTTLLVQVNAAGDYTLQITNTANGCVSDETINLERDTLPPLAYAGTDSTLSCTTPQIQIGDLLAPVSPELSYTWSGPGIVSGGNEAAPIVDSAGLYTLLVMNMENGCSTLDEVQIDADFINPQANAGDPFELSCAANEYVLNASASQGSQFTYEWSTDTGSFSGTQDTLNPTVNAMGNYTLTVTNSQNGCSSTSSVFIDQTYNTPIAVIAAPLVLNCLHPTIQLIGAGSSAGNSYQYTWTAQNGGNIVSGGNTLNPVVNQPGMYTLAVMDISNNCVTNHSVTVLRDTVAPVILVDTGMVITCTAPVINLNASLQAPGTYAFQWIATDGGFIIGGTFTSHPLVSSAGTYQVYALNLVNGCLSTDSVIVDANMEFPNAVIDPPDTLTCKTATTTLVVHSDVNTVEYQWNTNDGHFISPLNTASAMIDEPGIYEVLVTNLENGCQAVATTQVLADKHPPIAEAGISLELSCADTSIVLNGTGSSVGSQIFYEWSTSDGQILSGLNTLMPVINKSGTYQLLVIDEESGCMSTDQVQVNSDTILPEIIIPVPETLTCLRSQVLVQSQVENSGVYSYSWTTPNGNIVQGENGANLLVDAIGDYVLTIVNIANGCSNAASTSVTEEIVLPEADAGAPAFLGCNVDQIELQGTASSGTEYTYSWSTQDGQIVSGANTLTPMVNGEGSYAMTVLNTMTGCKKTDEVEVLRDPNIPTDFIIQMERPSCRDNDGIILFQQVNGGAEPYAYSIDNGVNYFTIPEFEDLVPGTYILRIRDANGCEFSKTLQVPSTPDPNISVIPEINLILGDSFDLQAVVSSYPFGLIDTIIWTPTEGLYFDGTGILDLLNPIVKPYISTEYTVTIISTDGCSASDRVLVRVDDEPNIYIPNAFSPWNNDNKNDIVFIFANSNPVTNIRKFSIYDRWGEKVFEDTNFMPNDPGHGWNGRFRGELLNPGVFVYYAEIDVIGGRVIVKDGDISLLR